MDYLIDALALVGVLAILAGAFLVWLCWQPDLSETPSTIHPEPVPRLVLPPDVTPVRPPVSQFTIRFIDERRRVLGQSRLTAKYRKPTMQWRDRGGKLGNFVADSCQGQTWTYRRVGIDRE